MQGGDARDVAAHRRGGLEAGHVVDEGDDGGGDGGHRHQAASTAPELEYLYVRPQRAFRVAAERTPGRFEVGGQLVPHLRAACSTPPKRSKSPVLSEISIGRPPVQSKKTARFLLAIIPVIASKKQEAGDAFFQERSWADGVGPAVAGGGFGSGVAVAGACGRGGGSSVSPMDSDRARQIDDLTRKAPSFIFEGVDS